MGCIIASFCPYNDLVNVSLSQILFFPFPLLFSLPLYPFLSLCDFCLSSPLSPLSHSCSKIHFFLSLSPLPLVTFTLLSLSLFFSFSSLPPSLCFISPDSDVKIHKGFHGTICVCMPRQPSVSQSHSHELNQVFSAFCARVPFKVMLPTQIII